MADLVYIKKWKTYATAERYWFDNSMVYVIPIGESDLAGTWIETKYVEKIKNKKDYYNILWGSAQHD